ncbi:hypothetical protein ASPBRDRAFT_429108 [Aspergillus brasiliensis CBS 101740]|uniref:Uncharacterized protein n=1 Tax=Aspergillus brasiliensis (strain CBS 101740 / IMI 381727 / IBT 21946) TaxID=767769 RepID=A0A1L9U3M7_ASPBC|nr:hypothetical protein ASPBRDRAFT_429108 [Aspergillus brasiliensis CBS 101740]
MNTRSALEPTERLIRNQHYQQYAETLIAVPTDGRRRRFVCAVSHILHVAVYAWTWLSLIFEYLVLLQTCFAG